MKPEANSSEDPLEKAQWGMLKKALFEAEVAGLTIIHATRPFRPETKEKTEATRDRVLRAMWESIVAVRFNAQGGTASEIELKAVAEELLATLPHS